MLRYGMAIYGLRTFDYLTNLSIFLDDAGKKNSRQFPPDGKKKLGFNSRNGNKNNFAWISLRDKRRKYLIMRLGEKIQLKTADI